MLRHFLVQRYIFFCSADIFRIFRRHFPCSKMALVNYLAWCLGTCRLPQIREDKLRFSHKCSEDDGIVGLRSIKSSSGSSSSTGTSSLLLTGICKWARSQAFEKKPRCCLLPPLYSSFLRNSTDLLACPKTGCKLVFFPEHMNQFVQNYKVFHRSADFTCNCQNTHQQWRILQIFNRGSIVMS